MLVPFLLGASVRKIPARGLLVRLFARFDAVGKKVGLLVSENWWDLFGGVWCG
jgi:hypothetical protein